MTSAEFEQELFQTYSLIRCLSEAPGRKVLLVRHKALGRDLVVRFSDRPLPVYRFLKDIDHPNLIRVYDVIALEDGFAALEEALNGLTVEQVLETGLYRYRGARIVLSGVCQALSLLHEAGFVHRDVKPSNVMILNDGHCKLLDYDASRIFQPTADTVRLGTPGYAAPEQYVGSSGVSSDVYALGMLLNIMLTGCHPSDRLPKQHRARKVIVKATQINPSDRFQSAEEFRRAL